MIEVFIQKEYINKDEIRYYAVGKYENNKFTGSVFGYEGGGVYGHIFMVDGKYIPQTINEECLEWEDVEEIFEQLSGTKSDYLEEVIGKYVVLDTSEFPYFKAIYGTESGLESNLVFSTMDRNPPSYANTYWSDTRDIKEFTVEELRSVNNEKINKILDEIEGL
jgi:hypothetical protein